MAQTHRKKKTSRQKQAGGKLPLFLVLGGALLVGAALLAVFLNRPGPAAVEVSGEPRLKVNQETVDLGDVKLGQTVQVSFELTNVGDQTLRFSEAPYIEVVEGC